MSYFRTPEEVAPELGMTPTELRRYCRVSSAHGTRLSKNRIMLDEDNVQAVIAYVKSRNMPSDSLVGQAEHDPFA